MPTTLRSGETEPSAEADPAGQSTMRAGRLAQLVRASRLHREGRGFGPLTAFTFNGLVQKRNVVDEAWNQISVQLKRRHDLIPNLVNAVKGYMDFEQTTLTRVVEARNAAVTAQQQGPAGAAQSAQAENFLTGALRQLFALVENYPQLKANENVMH